MSDGSAVGASFSFMVVSSTDPAGGGLRRAQEGRLPPSVSSESDASISIDDATATSA